MTLVSIMLFIGNDKNEISPVEKIRTPKIQGSY